MNINYALDWIRRKAQGVRSARKKESSKSEVRSLKFERGEGKREGWRMARHDMNPI
jgi:hypothetical protein